MDRDREKTMSGPGRHLGIVKGKGADMPLFVTKMKTSKKSFKKSVGKCTSVSPAKGVR